MYSTHNEPKSVVAEKFIRTLKNKIYKDMTSIRKNVYIDKVDDIINKYNNTYHRTTKMKLLNIKSSTYIDFNKENYKESPKFKVVNHVRISKYNWSEKVFAIKKVKNTVPLTYVICDLKDEEFVGTFHGKELQKTNQKKFRVE